MFQEDGVVHFYRVSGLLVSSQIDLPGLIANPVMNDTPDVTIRHNAVPHTLEGVTSKGPTWEIAGDQFLLRIIGIARFLVTGGRDIAFELEDGATQDDIAIFLIGTVFGILLHQREHIVLHASAVRVGSKAVLFCGPSGAGKSTIAAALGQRGYQLLNDDVCAIAMTENIPTVHPGWAPDQAAGARIEKLDLAERQGGRVRTRLEKSTSARGSVW